ncbi:MAG: hypothetical protein PVG66_07095 [Chromatiales bacterium]|jgi:hypothetical protein
MNNPHHAQAMPYAPWPYQQAYWPPAAYAPQAMSPYALPAYPPMTPPAAPANTGVLGLGNSSFIKGALIGAAAAYLLSNEQVQQAAIKTTVKVWSLLQGGVEEMKERFRDAEAEMHATQMQDE